MTTLVFFLEEPSAREMLQGVLPRLLPPQITFKLIVFEGKQDMHKQLERKLRGWLAPDTRFIVMRDQDFGDCRVVKDELVKICERAGHSQTLVRIACRELESFYLGDLQAVEQGLDMGSLAAQQQRRKFRSPDDVGKPSEELRKLTRNRYQKLSGSQAIGPHLQLDASNRSHSFRALIAGIRQIVDQHPAAT